MKNTYIDLPILLAIKQGTDLKTAGQIADLFRTYRKIGFSKYDSVFAAVQSTFVTDISDKLVDFDTVDRKTKDFLESVGLLSPKEKLQKTVRGIFRKEKCC